MVAIVIMWLFAVVTVIPYVTQAYDHETLLDGVICFSVGEMTTAAFVHLAFSTLTASLSSHVAIIFVVATVVFVIRNTVSTEVLLSRAMIKFAVLLLMMTFFTLGVNLFGYVPLAMGEAATLAIVVWFHLLSTYLLTSLPGIVITLLMAATFRPVRESMTNILTCHFKKKEAGNVLARC